MQTAINYCNAKTFAVNTKLEIDRYTRRIIYGYFKRTHTWLDF